MAERRHEEKEDEKRREKQEKEDEKRKGWDEKWRRNKLGAVTWAGVLIWGALILLAEATNYSDRFSWWANWAVFFAGAGVIILGMSLFRLLIPEHRRPVGGSLVIGLVFLGIGLGALLSWVYVWVVILIVIALTIVLRAFVPRR